MESNKFSSGGLDFKIFACGELSYNQRSTTSLAISCTMHLEYDIFVRFRQIGENDDK